MTELRGYANGRERREEILAAADAAFAKHGLRGASLATIAQEVGLSQPGVLHHLFSVLAAESVDDDRPAHEFFRDRYRLLRELASTRFAEEQREGRLAVDMVEVMHDVLARLD